MAGPTTIHRPWTDLETLRDLIFRKYQRRRAPYEDVQTIDRMISEHQGDAVKPARPATGE